MRPRIYFSSALIISVDILQFPVSLVLQTAPVHFPLLLELVLSTIPVDFLYISRSVSLNISKESNFENFFQILYV